LQISLQPKAILTRVFSWVESIQGAHPLPPSLFFSYDIDMEDESPKPTQAVLRNVIIYTDGAAEPNPGPGGYGIVLLAGKHRKELSGGFRRTTNNRMELLAVIVGLESLTTPCRVTIYSDSKYVVESVERGSVHRWSKNNWFRTKSDKAKNSDLWARFLIVYAKHQVQFKWVKGHAGVPENERCDVLAVEGAQSFGSPHDLGYLQEIGESPNVPESDASIENRSPNANSPHTAMDSSVTHKEAGEPCRKCGVSIIKKPTKPKVPKPGQTYYYEWYLVCPGCKTMYMVDDAKRML
jgi:ribonuclease HI